MDALLVRDLLRSGREMGVRKIEDLVALQLAVEFKREVYRLVRGSREAHADFRYRDQLFDAASSVEANIVEGWNRYLAGDFALFLRYALSSLAEARQRLRDGVDRGYLSEGTCQTAFGLADRCAAAGMDLHRTLRGFAASRPPRRRT